MISHIQILTLFIQHISIIDSWWMPTISLGKPQISGIDSKICISLIPKQFHYHLITLIFNCLFF